MKAYRIHEMKGTDGLRLDDLPRPEPGAGEVRIRVRAVSLNYRDLLVINGQYARNLPLPLVPCSDGAGEIDAVGPGVSAWKPGDRVAGCFFADGWIDGPPREAAGKSALGGAIDGMLVEERVLPAAGLVKIPAHLTFEEASTLPCAALTAWHALIDSGGLKPGESVLVQGTGGVSLFALQFSRMAGARVIATSSQRRQAPAARATSAPPTASTTRQPPSGARPCSA